MLTRREILDEVWDKAWVGDEHVVDVHVAHIRQKLQRSVGNRRYIVTIRGVATEWERGSNGSIAWTAAHAQSQFG